MLKNCHHFCDHLLFSVPLVLAVQCLEVLLFKKTEKCELALHIHCPEITAS